jgi:CPA2 family monovalent cation:H+ antiporter-2
MEIDLALIELGVIMLTLACAGRLAQMLGVSSIPLFLLVGLGFGEGGVLGIEEALPFIEVGSSLGVIFLLFMLGLEYTPLELRQSIGRNSGAGAVDLVLNATPGAIAGLVMGWGLKGALILAGVTYVSSSGIIAKLLTDLRRLGNRETPTILSILVIEDLVMAVFLPVVAIVLAGGSVAGGLASGGLAIGVVIAVLVFAPYVTRPINRIIDNASAEILLITLLGSATLIAGLAEYIHISYAIGAFLLGIVLSGQVAERARELLSPLRDSFAALFFVYFGLAVDVRDLWQTLGQAVVLALVGIITKVGTGWWAAKRAGVSPVGARRAAVALVPRGEFSIVLAGIGVSGGVNSDLSSIVVSYVLILAISGSVLARFVK